MISQYFNLYFPICSLFVNLILCILFFSKRKIKSVDTQTYTSLLLLSLVESFVMFFTNLLVCVAFKESNYWLFDILNKVLYGIYILWLTTLFTYMIKIANRKFNKIFGSILTFIDVVIIGLIFVSPIDLYYENGFTNSTGTASNVLYAGCSLYIIAMLVLLILDYHKAEYKKKYIPTLVMFFLMTGMMVLRVIDPLLNISSNVFSIITLIMYFTIENPDLKMLEEYVKNKKLTEDSIEDKANMLFKISQDVKVPANKIELLSNKIIRSNELNEIHDDARTVNTLSKNVSNVINNVLDISDIDIRNVIPVEISYNTKNLFNQIILLSNEQMNSELNFKYSISSLVPKSLYGDALKLKQVIYSFICNSIENTKSGSIDLDISSINRYDVCRLLITISDTGNGMSLDKINELLESSLEVSGEDIENEKNLKVDIKIAKKIIDIIGGTLIVKSEENRGTSFTIIVNQKIADIKEDNKTEKLTSVLSNKKKVLVVDDDYEELGKIIKELKHNNYEVFSAMYGQDCLDKLKSDIKFEYVFLDDEMDSKNAVEIIDKIDTKKNKVIVMLNHEKDSIKEHYLEDYPFYDYIMKDKFRSELERILNKK